MRFRTAHAESPATRPGMTAFEPAHESPARRMKKLVVIHYDPEMIALGMRMFGKTCDIPKGILRVRSLEDAKKIVDEHRPDIVLVGKRIGNSPDGCYELLEYAKLQNPDAKVVLWSGILRGDERREGAKCHYDAIVPRRDLNGIREAVGQFSG